MPGGMQIPCPAHPQAASSGPDADHGTGCTGRLDDRDMADLSRTMAKIGASIPVSHYGLPQTGPSVTRRRRSRSKVHLVREHGEYRFRGRSCRGGYVPKDEAVLNDDDDSALLARAGKVRWELLRCDAPGCPAELQIPAAYQYQSLEMIVWWAEDLGWKAAKQDVFCRDHGGQRRNGTVT